MFVKHIYQAFFDRNKKQTNKTNKKPFLCLLLGNILGLERWPSYYEHLLLLERTWVWVLASTWQLRVPVPELPSSGLLRHQALMWYTYVHLDKALLHVKYNK